MKRSRRNVITAGLALGAALAAAIPARAQTVYVAGYSSREMKAFGLDGTLLANLFVAPNVEAQNERLYLFDVAPNGTFYTSNAEHSILAFSPAGAFNGVFAQMTDYGTTGVAADAAGNVYAASFYQNSIRKYDSAGALLYTISTGLSGPLDIEIGPDGNTYVSNYYANTVERFDPAGNHLGTFASGAGLSGADGLAFDAAGNLYVTSRGTGDVRAFSSTGASLGVFASGPLFDPYDLAFDPTGNLYVTDFHEVGSVRKFSSTGAYLGDFATGLNFPGGIKIRGAASSSVPEPGVLALGVGAGGGAAGFLWRRKRLSRRTARAKS